MFTINELRDLRDNAIMEKKESGLRQFVRRHQKYGPVLFFIGGFIWDSLTLGRIDRLYDRTILCSYLVCLTACLYVFNLADDGKWKNTWLERYLDYLPLAIQFFLGGLSSAFVVYFSRSVSLSKTVAFFVILVFLLFANELFKHRISNKYLQFGAYFFVSFTFFAFFIPVLIRQMNTTVFMVSGVVSLAITLALIITIYVVSPSTRADIHLGKMLAIIASIYVFINLFYYFNLIPPVPLALDTGVAAYRVERDNDRYFVSYEKDEWYKFWRNNRFNYIYKPGEEVFVFSSIFAPTHLEKSVAHLWKWFSPHTRQWEEIEK